MMSTITDLEAKAMALLMFVCPRWVYIPACTWTGVMLMGVMDWGMCGQGELPLHTLPPKRPLTQWVRILLECILV